jgi:Type II secretion system (T2SS), protein E, N-terminal domain
MNQPDPATPLPTLMLDAELDWHWPQPPFARRDAMMPLLDGVQRCRVETHNGVAVEGELVSFDIAARELRFRIGSDGAPLALPFAKFRRVTLTAPWLLARRAPDAPVERVPSGAQERGYTVTLAAGGQLSGRTLGHVRQDVGTFLFWPLEGGTAVLRQFVPADAATEIVFGRSAEESAMERWVATPEALIAAIAAQASARPMALGDALLDLGLITRGQLEQALSEQGPDRDRPLGELLVLRGLITRADLQTALAHKMGYPLVDLTRYPLDANAVRCLSPQAMQDHHALPLLADGARLIVAVDELSRIPALRALESLAGLDVAPVLAPRGRLAVALEAVVHRSDLWATNVPTHLKSVTTR